MAVTQLLLAAKVALTDPTLADGVVQALTLNKAGRLRVASKHGSFDLITGTLAAAGAALVADIAEAKTVALTLSNSGTVTMAAGTFIFEASVDSTNGTDGTFYPLLATRTGVTTTETNAAMTALAAGANPGYGWTVPIAGFKWFRVRCSVAPTGSSIGSWKISRSSA